MESTHLPQGTPSHDGPDDSNPLTNKKPNAKHVSRACLQCRHRHLKCDGMMPKCSRCVEYGKDCSYVKSNRGGSRKKGVKKVKPNPVSDSVRALKLPCVGIDDGEVGACPNGHTEKTCGFLDNGSTAGSLPCLKRASDAETVKAISSIGIKSLNKVTQHQKFLNQEFNHKQIIQNYYEYFHNSHPVLPPLGEIDQFLALTSFPKEIIGVMKAIGDGYSSSKYSKNIGEIFQLATEIVDLMKSNPQDVITLQVMILLSLTCHISALHDLSTSLRKQAIELAITLDINNLDASTFLGEDINGNQVPNATQTITPPSDEMNINFYNSRRVRNLPDAMLKDSARRCFWELFFLDIIIGSADGKTLSKLTAIECFVDFPSTPTKFQFDYETRSHTSKLVDDSVRLNNIIFSETSIGHQYTKLTASLSNWELKFSNPDFYKLPYLIDGNGTVNEGIQQGLIMLNYARIFTHRPLSFLWRSDIPKNLKCIEKLNDELNKTENNFQEVPSGKDLINSRKIIETRKTIDAANLIAKTLIDTNPIDILKRTPLNACSLAFAGLVHLSAYLWSTQVVQSTDGQNHINTNDLNIYEEYLKLELSGIFQISAHWYLSSKIANYLLDSISKLLPDLFKKMETHFHHHIESDKKLEKDIKRKLEQQQRQSRRKKHNLVEKTEISKVHNPSSGDLEVGMSYKLPGSSISLSDIPTPNSGPTPQYQQFYSNSPASNTSSNKASSLGTLLNIDESPTQMASLTPLLANSISSPVGSVSTGQEIDETLAKNVFMDFNPVSPYSDSGCDWIDNNQLDFDFKNYNFGEFDLDSLSAIDELIKSAPSLTNTF